MSKLVVNSLTHSGNSSTENLTLDSSGNVTVAGNLLGGPVLEQFYTPCDGVSVTVPSGTYSIPNVSSEQDGTNSYVDLTGSSISYVPPSGTSTVIYKFDFQLSGVAGNANPIGHFKFFMDSDEVVYARMTNSSYQDSYFVTFVYPIPIGGTANTNTGRVATWTSAKTLKMQYREYGSSDQSKVHETRYWDGAQSDEFIIPRIGITALK